MLPQKLLRVATHFHATGHPILKSFKNGEDWIWCYIDQVAMEPG